MNYRGFEITKDKYIEERHPQYNYLCFNAICNEKYLYMAFLAIDMRIATEEQLLRIFISRLDEFIEYNTDTSAQPLSNKGEDIVRPILNNEGIELENKEALG